VILIHFLLIFIESETFQQTGQMISQGDSDLTENHFSRETETFLIHSESGAVPNTPLVSRRSGSLDDAWNVMCIMGLVVKLVVLWAAILQGPGCTGQHTKKA
jgi:hypothetical protein